MSYVSVFNFFDAIKSKSSNYKYPSYYNTTLSGFTYVDLGGTYLSTEKKLRSFISREVEVSCIHGYEVILINDSEIRRLEPTTSRCCVSGVNVRGLQA